MYLFGIPGVLFFTLVALFGYALLKSLKLPLSDLELAAASPIVGVVIASWLCLVPFLLSGSLDIGIIAATPVMLITVIWARPSPPSIERRHLPALAAIVLIGFIFMFSGLFTYFDGEYHAAFPFYGDAAFHAAMVNSFSPGSNYPPAYPMMAGEPLRYTFLIDFFSAALDRLGLGLQWSIVLPGWILFSGLLSLLYFTGTRFTGRRAGGAISVALLVLSGGVGIAAAALDWQKSGLDLLHFLASHNLNYTTYYELGLVFTNFTVIVMAQRPALIGFGAGACIILLMYAIFIQGEGDAKAKRNGLLAMGVLAGLLPMVHAYSYISVMVAAPLLLLLNLGAMLPGSWRDPRRAWHDAIAEIKTWCWFLVPALLIALPQALWLYSQMGSSHFKIEPGWMAGSLANMPVFWLKNMGVELLLLIAGLFLIGRANLRFYVPFAAIFVMANIFVFQPWDYDNHKFFSFWLMPSAMVMASALLALGRVPRLGKPLSAVLLVLCVLTGALVAAFIIGHPYVEVSRADLSVGNWIMDNTPKDAVFLTSDSPVHPVTTVAGRKSYLGYGGWLYTHGIDYGGRSYNVTQMYGAYDGNETMRLLKENGIGYVFIGPSELGTTQFYVNRSFFDGRFPCVFNWTDPEWGNTYKIYKV